MGVDAEAEVATARALTLRRKESSREVLFW